MDFGDILDKWEGEAEMGEPEQEHFKKWIDEHGIHDKDSSSGKDLEGKQGKIRLRSVLRSMKPQEEIDLHGLSKNEALAKLDFFLTESRRKGLKKVLIIHGKGRHSQQAPILGKAVREYLEQSSLTGEAGSADKQYGGSGALWVILR